MTRERKRGNLRKLSLRQRPSGAKKVKKKVLTETRKDGKLFKLSNEAKARKTGEPRKIHSVEMKSKREQPKQEL